MGRFEPQIKLEHADSRGEIYSIQLPDDRELMLLFSKKGSLRGGHAHDCDETITLLTGEILYHKRDEAGREWTEIMKAGKSCFVPKGLIHMGEFLEDSLLLEWKIGVDKKGWNNLDYAPYRDKVKANAIS